MMRRTSKAPVTQNQQITRLAYSPAEVSQMLGMARSTLHDLLKRGVVEHVRLPGTGRRDIVLIPQSALDQLLARYTVAARGGVS